MWLPMTVLYMWVRKHKLQYLCNAFAAVGISIVDRKAMSAVVIAPFLLVLHADHVSPVHDEQAGLVEAPDWYLRMA